MLVLTSELHLSGCPSKIHLAMIFVAILRVLEVFIVWHPVLVILDHVVDSHLQLMHAFLLLAVELLEVHHAEIIDHINNHLI